MDEQAISRKKNAKLDESENLQRQTKAKLRDYEERYRSLVECTGDIIFTISPDGTITSLNPAFETTTGWQRAQWVGKDFRSLIHPDDLPFPLEIYQRVFKREMPAPGFELRVLLKSGDYIPMEFTVTPQIQDGKVAGYLGIARDITERRRAEEALAQSEEKYRILIDNIQDGVFLIQDGKIEFANEAFARMCGYTAEEVIGMDFREFVAPEDMKMVVDRYLRRQAGEDIPGEYEFSGLRRDRTRVTVNMNVGLITYRGRVASMGTVKDITERKHAEEKIKEQAALLDKAHDAIIVLDLEHRITYWNKGAERLYGWISEEATGKNANDLMYREGSSLPDEAEKSVIEKGEWTGELHQVMKDGRDIIVESRWDLVRDNKGEPRSILIINTDITGKKRIETESFRAQRMESIGRLAGGIAHDLNNVLTPIMLSLQLLHEKIWDDESRKLLEVLERNTKRGAYLIRQVLSFARGVEGERKTIRVARFISEIERIMNETFRKSIKISIDIPEDIWQINGDVTQLNQVLMNLCINARDAMPDGGILSISAANVPANEEPAKINVDARAIPYVAITVSDMGTGIPPEIIDKIFEPFFTTKEYGTGIGLSTSLTIVKSHGGFIDVHSETGKGTTFKIYLPAAGTQNKPHEPPGENKGLVLIVNDDARIRETAGEALEAHGYRVFTACNGAEAVSLYSQNRENISVIIMDIDMTAAEGHASIWALRRIDPQVRLIATSRLTESDKPENTAGIVDAFLQEPYTAEKLLNTVREVIGDE